MHDSNSRKRGNALLMTLIALAVLMMVVAAAIQFTGTNREAAANKARADELQACAEVGRKVLISKLRSQLPATGISLDMKLPDSAAAGTDKVIRTGHVGNTAPEPVIVKLDSKVMGGSRYQVREMANTLAQTTLGGEYYRVVVTCTHPT